MSEHQISFCDIYKNLWECRNFEIEHVWHRAVFLSAFLLATYAGYGGLLVSVATAGKLNFPLSVLNGVAFLLSIVGLFFSILWIMMAKGSKAWYEHYEKAIEAFASHCKMHDVLSSEGGARAFREDIWPVIEFDIHKLDEFECPPTDCNILTARGGAYSVSKINIVIGHFSCVIWSVLLIAHLGISVSLWYCNGAPCFVLLVLSNPLAIGIVLAICILAFCVYEQCVIRSSFLKENC